MPKRIIMKLLMTFISLFFCFNLFAEEVLKSPDGNVKLIIDTENKLAFTVERSGELLIKQAKLDFIFDDESLLRKSILKVKRTYLEELIEVPVAYKNKQIKNSCNVLSVTYSKSLTIEFRAYNEGVAYRYITNVDREVEVNEVFDVTFSEDYNTWSSLLKNKFTSAYQLPYKQVHVSEFPDSTYTYLPLLVGADSGKKVLFTEADHFDYPHMFMQNSDTNNTLSALFPPFPLETQLYGDRRSRITKAADYIAKTNGKRSFPWRVLFVTENDGDLIESDLVYALSRQIKEDASWVKPGRIAWDWFNASNLYGVDFKAGLNTATWKYYVDFAADHGLEYVILDEGWSISTTDLTQPNPELELQYLIDYAKGRNVGIILWTTWRALNTQWEVLDKFVEWGAAGIKVDFMDRADQWMVNFYEKTAEETYKRQLLLDFHGSFKPTGLRRSYPNILAYEGVNGLEASKWSKDNTVENNLELPFIRMVCGPMDYTPGAMRNFHSKEFKFNFNRPASQGTRCHQVALFVAYESGLQMFADSPSNYEREQETIDFPTLFVPRTRFCQ